MFLCSIRIAIATSIRALVGLVAQKSLLQRVSGVPYACSLLALVIGWCVSESVSPRWPAQGIVETGSQQGYSTDLFDGQSLQGWIVDGCEVEVVDRSLRLIDGDGFIRSELPYKNFELQLEWRPLKDAEWDSGIYFRAALPDGESPWPQKYQVNLRQGQEGKLIGKPDTMAASLENPRAWNRMRLRVEGTTAGLHVNGVAIWQVDDLEPTSGFVGIQSEVPLGGQFEFREISIRELDHSSLFNGTDLTGWTSADNKPATCWLAEAEELICTGEAGSWLRSNEEYDDFNLRLEYQHLEAGNSGIYIRVPADGNHHGSGAGMEVQILDDRHDRYAELAPYQYSGSLYAVSPAQSHPGRPAGQWNCLEIDCHGNSYLVRLNGVIVVETDADQTPALNERRSGGFLGLQNHQEEVRFRRIRLGPSALKSAPE